MVAVILGAIAAPVVAPYSPLQQDLSHILSGPSWSHLLGTDSLGRDVLSRLIYGARPALGGAGLAILAFVCVGVPTGLAAGYYGGGVDSVAARLADIGFGIPLIVLLLVVLAVFSGNMSVSMIVLGIAGSPQVMRVSRAVAMTVRRELYVDAAKVAGLRDGQIIVRHILPRTAGPIIVQATLFAGTAIVIQAGLGFLGLGVTPPNPSWGGMVAEAYQQLQIQPWLMVPSGATVALVVVSLGLIGDGVRDSTGGRSASRPPVLSPTAPAAANDFAFRGSLGAPNSLLAVRDLCIVAGDATTSETMLVQNLSFDVLPGEVVGLVGESGCGKTITSLALMQLLPPGVRISGGECWLAGVDMRMLNARAMRRMRGSQIAMISQEPMVALDPVFTVQSQLSEIVRTHENVSRSAARAHVRQLLATVGLPNPERVARSYPHELSGGMAQRVVIAAALAGNPKLLVADEPTTALDVTVQAEILDLLRALQRDRALAILLVTHDWGVVADLCQRAIVMYAGQVVEYANVEPVFRSPAHPYTLGLLEANPDRADANGDLMAIPGTVPHPGSWPDGCRFAPRCRFATEACTRTAIELASVDAEHYTRCILRTLREEQAA